MAVAQFATQFAQQLGRPGMGFKDIPWAGAEGLLRLATLTMTVGGLSLFAEGIIRQCGLAAVHTPLLKNGIWWIKTQALEKRRENPTFKLLQDILRPHAFRRYFVTNNNQANFLPKFVDACFFIIAGAAMGYVGNKLHGALNGNLIIKLPPIYNNVLKTVFGLTLQAK